MSEKPETNDHIVLLADESAAWQIAGLSQLDRLALAVDELTSARRPVIDISVFWRPDIAETTRGLAHDSRLKRVQVSQSFSPPKGARALTTRLLVDRNGLREYLEATPAVRPAQPMADAQKSWRDLDEQLKNLSGSGAGWKYLKRAEDLRGGERFLLGRTGKSQDGMVSRFINRPLTRPITLLLLRLPVTPTNWTLAIFVLPVAAFVLLLRGDYLGVVGGCALQQLYSMLDGCDGEIARAKYLESERGGRLDSFCDLLGGFLFVVGLGWGLSRVSYPPTNLYAVEGVTTAALIAVHEWLLRVSQEAAKIEPSLMSGAVYARHREVIEQSGILFLGEKFVWWILQLTKRDVAILAFLVMAIADLAPWILHYSLVAAAIGLGLSAITRLKTRVPTALP